ncbi:MAG: hypothetical protein NZ700_07345, partial [Gemmataceae bacterium]|nr:hypothetical protein [Gemmataceae bacterium]MDW8264085.1 hypothetical protein [Gemmataceae bacterium]
MHPSRSTIVHELAERIRAIEGSGSAAWPPARGWGIEPLDALLPEGRGAAGVLVELLSSAEGAGAWSLAVALAWPVCGEAKVLVVVDERRGFYPPAVARWGIDLERLMVVRPRGRRDRLWAWQQALRCPAVGAVVGDGEPLPPLDARRLQLAAETGGSLGLLLR